MTASSSQPSENYMQGLGGDEKDVSRPKRAAVKPAVVDRYEDGDDGKKKRCGECCSYKLFDWFIPPALFFFFFR